MSRFEGKVAVVTGAASGIGRAVTVAFVREGARVVAADVDEPGLASLATELGDAVRVVRCDVGDRAQVQAAVEIATEGLGGLDVFVNNAGVCEIAPIPEMTDEQFERMFSVNLRGTLYGIQAAVPVLAARGGGAIVNVASTAGLNGAPLIGGYGATKAAVVSLTRTASAELRPAGIRVNVVCPAMVRTPFSAALVPAFEAASGQDADAYFEAKQGRLGEPEDVAAAILHLASFEASWVTGQAYVVDGGLLAASI